MFWRSIPIIGLTLAVGALALCLPEPARAAGVLYTVTSLDDVGDLNGECTLREAIISSNGILATDCGGASSGEDEIEFAVSGTIQLTGDLPAVNDILTIGGGNVITIDGVELYRIFTVNGGKTLRLKDIVLYHAFASTEGGAIRSFGTLYITNTSFISNRSNAGGGAIYSYSIADISDSEFKNNISATGGAIMNPGILGLNSVLFQENIADVQSKGGAIWSSGPLTISGNQFVKNKAGSGGAIYARRIIDATSLSINSSTFDNNLTTGEYPDANGGALLVDNPAATINASLFVNNGGQSGGAIYVMPDGNLTLNNSTLRDQSETTNGGGIYNLGTARVTNSTLSGNQGDHGGGIDNFGLLFLTNVTLSGNDASYGGGLKNEGGIARLSNITLSGNSASNGQGGGIMNTGLNTHLNLTNVLVANSPAGGNCAFSTNPDLSQFNLSSDNNCHFGFGRDNINVQLGPLANNGGSTLTHLPLYTSPAIDNGTDDDAPSIDQRGVLRPQGNVYDVGSVEVVLCATRPPKPELKKPPDGKTLTTINPKLKWRPANCARNYKVIVKDALTGKTVDKQGGLTVLKYKTVPLAQGKTYKWFVKACNPDAPKPRCRKSDPRLFTIE